MIPDDLTDALYQAILDSEEAAHVEKQARAAVLEFMTTGAVPGPVRTGWGVISTVTTPTYTYRDGGVTHAMGEVKKAEAALKVAKANLKGAQNAAKASGGARAKVTSETVTLRVQVSG